MPRSLRNWTERSRTSSGSAARDAEDALFARRVSMFVLMVVVVVVVVVVVGVIVGVVMCMPMIMAMIVCVMAVAMIVAVSVVMAVAVLVRVAMILLFGMRLCVRSAFVFEPELWHSISDYASECAKFSQCVSDTVL
jgi:hypothetical protein